ncbi:LysE family translocator [Paracoccus aestuarii]|uniref:LysE family translocator n=1 Tax=Paracoccus aestuarii TaxID=453842 RepID=A0A418ZZJ8_9RHOB|nr:LysE family translocator [Paracoccus aestuarii]RJL06018.1 LysE family translocator [Paracoccus aestuarii]WCQ99104.1 LysE family translocator [Paracoccus aestuarii]
MTSTILAALLGFAFVTTVTPGPNNLMLMASGANFGFRRTVPHMLGIAGGVSLMALLVGLGLMALFEAVPVLGSILKVVSVLYLLWLAYKIATAAPIEVRDARARPIPDLMTGHMMRSMILRSIRTKVIGEDQASSTSFELAPVVCERLGRALYLDLGGRHPAAVASATEQNQRSPWLVLICVAS